MVRNSFIANVNILVRKLELLLNLNEKFSDKDVNSLIELSRLNLGILITDMENGDLGMIHTISTNIETLSELLSKYPEFKTYSEDLSKVVLNINMLQVINDSLPYLVYNEDSISNSLTMLKTIYDSLDSLPDDVAAIQEASRIAVERANEIMLLSIAVDDAPYGHSASATYNAETGMLTIRVPQGPKGDSGVTKIKDVLTSEADLPTTGTSGDAYLINSYMYVWLDTTSKWSNVGLMALNAPMENLINTNAGNIAGMNLRLTTIEDMLVQINATLETLASK